MKQLRLIIVIALLALSSNVNAQPYLTLSGDPALCNSIEVGAYIQDASCQEIGKTLKFLVAPGMAPTTYDLSQPIYWPSGSVPTGTWTIQYFWASNMCGLNNGIGSTCPSGYYNNVKLLTGINGCNTATTTDCFEYSTTCSTCGTGDFANFNLTVTGGDVDIFVY